MNSDFWGPDEEEKTSKASVADYSSSRKQRLVKFVLMSLGALSLVGLGGAGVMYGINQKPELFGMNKNSANSTAEVQKLVKQLSKLIELPSGETPTLATVSDLDKVKDQTFFKNAKVGDKVLVYATAKKAYLYRPSEDKIIEVGVVNIPAPTGAVAGSETQQNNIQVISATPIPTNLPTPTPQKTFSVTPTSNTQPTPTIETPPQP